MRDLVFKVNAQSLAKDKSCDFGNIVAGSMNYLNCRFIFDADWNGFKKVAVFKDKGREEAVLLKDGQCVVPPKFSNSQSIEVWIVGQKGEQRIVTNKDGFVQVSGSAGQKSMPDFKGG